MSERDEFEAWYAEAKGQMRGWVTFNKCEAAWQAARAMQAMPALTEPVAWMHVMDNTEGIPENKPWVKITQSPENPFGVPGEDYSESFPVTSTPLYAAPQPSQDLDRVPERSAMYDRIMSGRYPNPDEATKPSTSFPKYQD